LLERKIKGALQLKPIIAGLKRKGRRIVFTNGCFDLLHFGHVSYLEKAKAKGDVLVVAVNSDASVRRIKGRRRPITSQRDRARVIAALQSVDYVTLFGQDTPLAVIKLLRPDVLVKGADWPKKDIVGAGFVASYGGKVVAVALEPARSTTGLIKKIAKL